MNCETLTSGTPAEIEAEVTYALRHAARSGGLVICSGNTLMPGTRYENYLAMVTATREHGRYPIS